MRYFLLYISTPRIRISTMRRFIFWRSLTGNIDLIYFTLKTNVVHVRVRDEKWGQDVKGGVPVCENV